MSVAHQMITNRVTTYLTNTVHYKQNMDHLANLSPEIRTSWPCSMRVMNHSRKSPTFTRDRTEDKVRHMPHPTNRSMLSSNEVHASKSPIHFSPHSSQYQCCMIHKYSSYIYHCLGITCGICPALKIKALNMITLTKKGLEHKELHMLPILDLSNNPVISDA